MARKYIEIQELKISNSKKETRTWIIYPGQTFILSASLYSSDPRSSVYTLEVDQRDKETTFGKHYKTQRNLIIPGRYLSDFCILDEGDSIPIEFGESRKLHRNHDNRWDDII